VSNLLGTIETEERFSVATFAGETRGKAGRSLCGNNLFFLEVLVREDSGLLPAHPSPDSMANGEHTLSRASTPHIMATVMTIMTRWSKFVAGTGRPPPFANGYYKYIIRMIRKKRGFYIKSV